MDSDWQKITDRGWITIPEFGRINPRRDNESGGRQYFTAYMDDDQLAEAVGSEVTGGPETYFFELDQPFFLSASDRQRCIEVNVSVVPGGLYCVRYRPGEWPNDAETKGGGWV